MRLALFLLTSCTWQIAVSQSTVRPYAPELFSSKVSGAICGFSKDGKTVYFVREDTLKDKLFFYQAERINNKWSNEKILPFSGRHNDLGGRFTPNGKTFYFSSDRPGGSTDDKDGWNIWIVDKTSDSWSEPIPLLNINNKGSECCAVPMKDGSLLFSSDRGKPEEWWIYSLQNEKETTINQLTYKDGWQWPSFFVESENILFLNSMKRPDTKGKDDIYVSVLKNNLWSTPINIGDPINTSVYEDGAILSPDGKLLIFNQHETGATPSQVMCTDWKPLLKALKKQLKDSHQN